MIVTLSKFSSILLYFFVFLISSQALKIRTSKWMRVIIIAFLPVVMGGIRYYIGYDYGSYLWGFELIKEQSWDEIFLSFQFLEEPIAFLVIEKLVSYTDSITLFYTVTSALCYVPVVLYIIEDWNKQHDKNDVSSRSLFMYLLWFYTFGLSAIKQGIAMAFCFYGLKFVFSRKFIHFLITIIIATLFHPSAIVFLVVYFLWSADGSVRRWKKLTTIVSEIIFIVGFEYFIGRYGGTYSDYAGEIVNGRNLTFWIMLGWTIMFLIFRKNLLQLDKRNELLIMLFIIGTALQLLGFTNAFTKRIGQYFLVTQCLLLSQVTCAFAVNDKKLVWWLIVLFNMFLFVMQYIGDLTSSGMLPYKFIIR